MRIINIFGAIACLLTLSLALAACESASQSGPAVGIVDVEQVLRESAPAQAARTHLEAARAVLQKGMNALEEEWKDAPEAERRKAVAEGLAALNRQLAAEEAAANAVVMQLLRGECEKWRATHRVPAVASRQNLLAADAGADITAEVIAAMNARSPVFPALPTVQIKKREKMPAK